MSIQSQSSYFRLHGRKRWMPLRLRLALWSAGLVFFLSLALLIFVNGQTLTAFPGVIKDPLLACSNNSQCTSKTGAFGTKLPSLFSTQSKQMSDSAPIVKALTHALRNELGMISLIGLGLVALLGGAGAYLLSGFALRPLRQMSETARRIHSETLYTRLAWQGPSDEVRELADTFDAMLERLEQTFEAQKRFVADVSHELRTPLALLRTNLEVVATDPAATVDDYHEMMTVQERALSRLERLMSDLLLLATSEQPASSELVALAPVIEEVMSDVQDVAHEQRIELSLHCEADVVVAGDSLLLARVFSNLIENAICYNRQDGKVAVTLTQENQQAVVRVVDTGIGIPSDQQASIFDRFSRVDRSRTRRSGGAGLGLSLVQAIVHQHGGQVQVESTPGSGSVFTVRLSLSQEKAMLSLSQRLSKDALQT